MIEREALQDVRKYKKTFIGSLTLREFICISLATVVCVPAFFFLSKYFVRSAVVFFIILLALPFVLCGWKEVYGLPFEKFAFRYIKNLITRSKNRVYCSENIYNDLFEKKQIKLTKKEIKEIQKANKKNYDDRYKSL